MGRVPAVYDNKSWLKWSIILRNSVSSARGGFCFSSESKTYDLSDCGNCSRIQAGPIEKDLLKLSTMSPWVLHYKVSEISVIRGV